MMQSVRVLVAVGATAVLAAGCTSGGSTSSLVTDRVDTGGVTVVVHHPSDWHRQLSPQNRHYSEATALLANFELHDPCTPTNLGQGISCHDELMGAFPQDGVLVTIGWTSGGPGPHTPDELLAKGTPTTVGGRRAGRTQDVGKTCAGIGATHSIDYVIDSGAVGMAARVSFCWRGDDASVAAQIRDSAATLVIEG
jgi:hypothetical protein